MALPIHVAAVQYATEADNNTANTDRAIHLLDIAGHTADLILMPDASFTCDWPTCQIQRHTQAARGPLTAIAAQIAVVRSACICYCIPERDGDRIYNTAILVCADGRVVGSHRKLALNEAEIAAGFTAGDSLRVLHTFLGRIGILIGEDCFDPGNAAKLANEGAQIILVPSVALVDSPDAVDSALGEWERALRESAVESHCHLVWANKIGADRGMQAIGNSMIVAPDGDIIARAGMEEEIVRARITLTGIAQAA